MPKTAQPFRNRETCHGYPLCVQDNRGRPFGIPIDTNRIGDVLENFVQIVFQLWHQLEHGEGRAEHADAEVEVSGDFWIVRHRSNLVEKQFDHLLVVQPDSFETMRSGTSLGEVMVPISMDFDGVMRNDAEISRGATRNGVE